jgi:hypothetical protein
LDLSIVFSFLVEAPMHLVEVLPRMMKLGPVWWVAAFFYTLLLLYLAAMNLYRAHKLGLMTKLGYVVFSPILVVGLVFDFIGNLFFTIPFLQLPREWTITTRLRKIVRGTSEWRIRIAKWIARHFLDPFDPDGRHI